MNFLGWVDFSPEHKSRVDSVLDLFLQEGVVDELGVGIIRDALADKLFPGISTIQTRAKYYFIIPYIIKDYSSLSPALRNKIFLRNYLSDTEHSIIWDLAEQYNHIEGKGIIGVTMRRPQKLARRPSSIYWFGILSHGLIKSKLSLAGYLEKFERKAYDSLKATIYGDDSQQDAADAEYEDLFGINVPYAPNWRDNLSIDLSNTEADVLKNKFIDRHKNMLLGEILKYPALTRLFISSENFDEFTINLLKDKSIKVSDDTRNMLQLAYSFSKIMEGAHIRYNCILQNRYGEKGVWEDDWNEWKVNILEPDIKLDQFDLSELFDVANRTRDFTKRFIENWSDHIKNRDFNISYLDELVSIQEKKNKGRKSRLRQDSSESIDTWIGLRKLSYRFNVSRQIIKDIVTGLKK